MTLQRASVSASVLVALAGGALAFRQWTVRSPASAVAAALPSATSPAPGDSVPTSRATVVDVRPRASAAGVPAAPPAAPPRPAGPLTRSEKATRVTVSQLESLRSTIALWKLMHDGREPDFVKSPRWEQFVTPDDKNRTALERPPVNPFNGYVRVLSAAGGVAPGHRVNGDGAGWVYDRAAAKLWAVDAKGAVFDDAAVDRLALETRGVREMPPEAARRSVIVITQSLRSQVALYKLQHDDRPPDFARYPAWEQLRSRTTRNGTVVPADAVKAPGESFYGPYVRSLPVNPLNARYKVAVVADDLRPGQAVSGDFGFVFSTRAERFYSLDADGRAMTEPPAGAEWTAPRPGGSRSSGASDLQSVRVRMMLYKLQHNDDEVDLTRYPNWEQLTGRTRVDGTPDPAGKYGPYLAKPPVNWRNGSAAVEVVRKVQAGYRTHKHVGFVQDGTTGRIWLVDERGALVAD